MSHICRLPSHKGERKLCKHVPVRMQSDIRGVSPTSGGACQPSYLPVLLLFHGSPAVREELVSAPIKGKMPILHRVSEQPQSINQPAGKETDIMCVCVCLWLLECLSLHLCVSAHVQQRQRLIQVYYSAIFEKGRLIRGDAIINVSCGSCLKEEGACNVFDTKGRGRVCSRHKAHADCTTTSITGAEDRQQT